LRNQRIWEYALRGRGAPGRVVRLIRRDRVAELLRQQVRKIRAPDVVANKRRSIVQQVSVAICHRRNGDQPGIDTLALARALEIAEEKQLVLFDRTADRSTKLVLAIEAAFRREKVSGIERGVSQELKSASVNLIGTRLGDHIHHAAGIVAILGVEIVGKNPKLGDRIQIRNYRRASIHQFFNVSAVDQESIGVFALAADGLIARIESP